MTQSPPSGAAARPAAGGAPASTAPAVGGVRSGPERLVRLWAAWPTALSAVVPTAVALAAVGLGLALGWRGTDVAAAVHRI
ncbi:MAG TPA: hypothetical protein VKV25_04345, partial [Acidimicrobiales bacterium]|nr:hypothetical protein [Acidimicrobiales bacterium]